METIRFNENVTLGYEHEPIISSSNAITGTRYITKVFLIQGTSRYPLETVDGKLDEESIKMRFAEEIGIERQRLYGQQQGLLRKDLIPARDRMGLTNPRRKGFGQEPSVGESSIVKNVR